MDFENLRLADAEIYAVMEQELGRQRDHIELIASENFTSPAVMEAVGSYLTNKYAEGYPGKRYYGGCEHVDVVEDIARQRACELFGAEHANVQPHAGSQANMAVYLALCKPGDVLMGMDLSCGGHLTHGSKASITGKYFDVRPYGVDKDSELIDYDELRRQALELQPKMIISGASAYSRIIDWKRIREICDECGAYMFVDMAHIGGLVAAGVHPSPVPYADVLTTTAHNTLRGPLMHVIAGKAVCFKEAMSSEFVEYQRQVVKNAAVLSDTLKAGGMRIVSGGTDNHLLLADVMSLGVTGRDVQELLDRAHITANKNTIPYDTQPPHLASGVRFGSPAATTRGMKEAEMRQIGELILRLVREGEDAVPAVRSEVMELCERFPLYPGVI